MDGWVDGWTDGWVEKLKNELVNEGTFSLSFQLYKPLIKIVSFVTKCILEVLIYNLVRTSFTCGRKVTQHTGCFQALLRLLLTSLRDSQKGPCD